MHYSNTLSETSEDGIVTVIQTFNNLDDAILWVSKSLDDDGAEEAGIRYLDDYKWQVWASW